MNLKKTTPGFFIHIKGISLEVAATGAVTAAAAQQFHSLQLFVQMINTIKERVVLVLHVKGA